MRLDAEPPFPLPRGGGVSPPRRERNSVLAFPLRRAGSIALRSMNRPRPVPGPGPGGSGLPVTSANAPWRQMTQALGFLPLPWEARLLILALNLHSYSW